MTTRTLFAVLLLVAACSPRNEAKPPTEPSSEPPPADTAAAPSGGDAGAAKTCGGIAGLACPAGSYCSFPPEAQCGAADQTGTCAPIPEMCTEEMNEVCGCDDKTYSNPCKAAAAGVSVLKPGPCAGAGTIPEGKLCGTRGVPGECAEGLFCAFAQGCGADDRGGTCRPKPQMCTKEFKPVCGCDGRTHPTACQAASVGVSVASLGACPQQ